jgi:phospholipase D1/2
VKPEESVVSTEESGRAGRARTIMRIAAVVAVVAVAVVVWTWSRRNDVTPEELTLQLRVIGASGWAPVVFVALYLLFGLTLLPPALLSAAAALMWGWAVGGAVELFAATLSSLPPYLLAREAAGEWIARKAGKRFARYTAWVVREGAKGLFLLRLIPLIPWGPLNYIAGALRVPLRTYLVVTAVGMIPSIFAFTYSVDAVAKGVASPREAAWRVFVAGGILIALALASLAVSRRLGSRSSNGSAREDQ